MTDSNYTAVAVLMDRSGSMQLIREDAQGAVNAFVEEQKKLDGKCTVRLSQFDTVYEEVYPSTDIADVEDYVLSPRGGTALTDSIAKLVIDFGNELLDLPEDDRPGKVIVVIVTDGAENSSREFTAEGVKSLIEEQKSVYNWEFLFLAAGQDAIATGAGYGFAKGQSLTFDAGNITQTINTASSLVSTYRGTGAYHISDEDRENAVK